MIRTSVANLGRVPSDNDGNFSAAKSATHDAAEQIRAALRASVQTAEPSAVDFVLHSPIGFLSLLP